MNRDQSKRKDSENLAIPVTFNLSSSSVMLTVLIEFHQEKTIRLGGTIKVTNGTHSRHQKEKTIRISILPPLGTLGTIKSRQLERTIKMTSGAHGQNATKDKGQRTDASKERRNARHYYVNLKALVQEGTIKSRHQEEKTIRIQNQPSLVENLRGVLTTSLSPTMLKLSGINQVTVVQV